MERIKQALDKARAEREPLATTRKADAGSESRVTTESEIKYSQTQIVELNEALLKANRVMWGSDDRVTLTAYKMLRTQVLQRMLANSWNALALSSPTPGDGKTLTAVNLAISLARELQYTVLLVDLDLLNPNVHKYFGIEPKYGIEDYLLNGVSLNEILVNPGVERLVLLPAKRPVANSSELLAAPVMKSLVQELKTRYPSRFVLFDLPPVLSADDALSFSPFIDALLLVLREGKTTGDEVKHALDVLKDVPIIGTVLNASRERASSYY